MRIIIAILFLSLIACNSVRRNKTNETYVIKQDSAAVTELNGVSKTDSSAKQDENNITYHTGDSALDSEMEIVMQQQKDYANGVDTLAHFPPRPVIIERSEGKVIIDPGSNRIERIRVREAKQGSKKDSVVQQKTVAVIVSNFDSTYYRDSTRRADSTASAKANSNKQSKRFPTSLAIAIGVIGLVFVILVVLIFYYKKKAGAVGRVIEQVADKLPEA